MSERIKIDENLPPSIARTVIEEQGGPTAFLEKNTTPGAAFLVLKTLFPPEVSEERAVVPPQRRIYGMGNAAVARQFNRDAYA